MQQARLAAREAEDLQQDRSFAEVWTDNVRLYDDPRLDRLGDEIARCMSAGAGDVVRAGLVQALVANAVMEGGSDLPNDVQGWSVEQEVLADELAWAAEDRGDPDAYSRCFRQARAYGSVREATADVDDASAIQGAFYELLHSVETASQVLDVVAVGLAPWPDLVRAASQP